MPRRRCEPRASSAATARSRCARSTRSAWPEGGWADFDAGAAALREALTAAQDPELANELATTYVNLAELLSLAGRVEEALELAREGLGLAVPGTRGCEWLALSASELAYHAGRWEEAESLLPSGARRRSGTLLMLYRLIRALLALGRGELDGAEADLEAVVRALAESTEVQFVGLFGWERAELARRRGELDAARAEVESTLDRIEFCSDDMYRIALVAEVGTRVEADAAQAARDRGDGEAEAAARGRAAALLERVELAAAAGGPLERATLAAARAEHARATAGDDPEPWDAAARAWLELGRPYPALYARLREAEALVTCGERATAAAVTAAALEGARELGSDWLAEALESLAARARLRLAAPAADDDGGAEAGPPERPFDLTARELQVLALVARGATNREIGAELHMAEKTASVHVSRILAKLDVRSRTEAAAVAHRQGLAELPV